MEENQRPKRAFSEQNITKNHDVIKGDTKVCVHAATKLVNLDRKSVRGIFAYGFRVWISGDVVSKFLSDDQKQCRKASFLKLYSAPPHGKGINLREGYSDNQSMHWTSPGSPAPKNMHGRVNTRGTVNYLHCH
ncbi:hypothetical protein TNCV_5068651 [Trichonephila clavipes]|nr:hypothetical protein TNCV_5068651 [Trichonephila clavipes]